MGNECKVISLANQKGGVGKTVSCVNLGIGLAKSGKKVLLIDADPQGSMTISLGIFILLHNCSKRLVIHPIFKRLLFFFIS